MGFWGRGEDVVDLTGGYRSQSTKRREIKEDKSSEAISGDSDGDAMRLLGGLANSAEFDQDEKRENDKALSNMTERIEELSNQIYRVEQRLEIIEKKLRI